MISRALRAITFILMFNTLLTAQLSFDARAAGTAYSISAAAQGLGSVGVNPASLAVPQTWKVEINLISFDATANNNSLKKSQYDRFLTTGNEWSGSDIDEILGSIPDRGMRADLIGHVNTLAFSIPYFSASLIGTGLGVLNVPRDVYDLPLNGTTGEGKVFDLHNAFGVGWSGIGVMASGAVPLIRNSDAGLQFLAVGLTFKYISGLEYVGLEKAEGELSDFDLQNNDPFLSLNADFAIRSSEGGEGVGIDLGGLAVVAPNFTIGLTFSNLLSSVKWDKNNERYTLQIDQDRLTFPGFVDDSLIVDTTTVQIGEFTTHLPFAIDLGLAYQWTPDWLISAEYEQGFNRNMGGTRRARVAAGVEYWGLRALPLRAGVSFGGKPGTAIAFGTGINFEHWYLNLAVINHGRLIPGDYKGITLGISSRLRF